MTTVSDSDAAYERALGYLSYRPRSIHEMRTYLQKKGYEENVAAEVLDRLAAVGLVNDEAFATFWTSSRGRFSPRGDRALRYELRQKGVDRDTIDSTVCELPNEAIRAMDAGRRRLNSLRNQPEQEFQRRMSAFLSRRGLDLSDG